ncbi:MAG TPA: flagellar export chaperone FliS [Desulfotomaculum sp.]|jgi:flagellar protein FliS|nr:flagellar export chaperone FliS [Desulfotomaculum sp.]
MVKEQITSYAQNKVTTAPPEKLVLMLYEEALNFIAQAKQALEAGNLAKTNYFLGCSQKILNELRASLNFEAGEIAFNLERIYEYLNFRLMQANVKKDAKVLTEVVELLTEIKGAWAKSACKLSS